MQRNMRLAHAVAMANIVEMEGSGIPTAVENCLAEKALVPSVTESDGFVNVVVYPRTYWAGSVSGEFDMGEPNDRLMRLLQRVEALQESDPLSDRVWALVLTADAYVGLHEHSKANELVREAIPLAAQLGDAELTKKLAYMRARLSHYVSPR